MKFTSKLRVEQIQDESDEKIIDDFSGTLLKNMSIETELVSFAETKVERKLNPLLGGIENANVTFSIYAISSNNFDFANKLLDRIISVSMDAETTETAKQIKYILKNG